LAGRGIGPADVSFARAKFNQTAVRMNDAGDRRTGFDAHEDDAGECGRCGGREGNKRG
jgi:hypothetical protein